MGNLKWSELTAVSKGIIMILAIGIGLTAVYYGAPGLRTAVSQTLEFKELNSDNINNVTAGEKLPLPSESVSSKVSSDNLIRIAEYAWNGNSAMIVANGGPRTTEGSLMEANNVSLEIVRQDMLGGLRDMQVKFVEEFDKGAAYPKSDKSAVAVSIMGDGVPFYITTTQKMLDDKFGANKYHVQAIASYGLSYGEDKLIGPKKWRDNPQTMKGALVSSVIGDGDWVVACNFAFANKIKVNPDPTTYDADALNFVPSQDDDYINSVKELIKSQKSGFKIPLDVVKDGKRTGEKISKSIDGATTWTPGDKLAFDNLEGFTDVASTKDFINQMATTLVIVKEWAVQHDKEVINLLKSTYVAANQIKQYDEWAVRASQAVAKTYDLETPKYWYDLFKGQKGSKAGVDYNIGGTRVFNLADALQYYGVTDGQNRYEAVYNQVSSYLTDLNPAGFNESNKNGVVPFEDAFNPYFIKSIDVNKIDAGKTEKISYSAEKTEVLASGQWNINFRTASSTIEGSGKDLETIYNLLVQSEESKLKIVGFTDNVGNSESNVALSKGRANSVVQYLTNRGINSDRFQLVDGKGDASPVADNSTEIGRAKNRRVEITFLK